MHIGIERCRPSFRPGPRMLFGPQGSVVVIITRQVSDFCKCCGGLLRPPDAAAAELAMACVLAPFEIGCAHVTPFGPLGVGRAQGAEKDSWQYIGRVDS